MKDSDRELLELAAKAMGEKVGRFDGRTAFLYGRQYTWQPLCDDGDAFRVAVALQLDVCMATPGDGVGVWVEQICDWVEEPSGADRLAATRRAIVRAAAEIGKRK